MTSPLRPPGFDDLGVKRALSDRLLPSLVAAMAFLAALALALAIGATALAQHWQQGAGGTLTIQVPQPGGPTPTGTRLDRVRAILATTAGIGTARTLGDDELRALLRPWLGNGGAAEIAIPLPAVIDVQLTNLNGLTPNLANALDAAAPGTLVEPHDRWVRRLAILARSLQACAGLALAVVAFIAVAVIAVATRAGLASRRDAIEIVYGLGATDRYIARSFARRATFLAGLGAVIGTLAALPVLAGLASLAAPFSDAQTPADLGNPLASPATSLATSLVNSLVTSLGAIPPTLWLALVGLPPLAALIGWTTAQRTVRRWLRRLP